MIDTVEVPEISDDEELYRPREAARFLGIAEQTLRKWRHYGQRLPYYKVGARILYAHSDLVAFRRDNTQYIRVEPNGASK